MTTGFGSFLVEAAYAQDPITSSSLSWTDITARTKRFNTNRGHQNRLDSFQPGTAQVTFDEHDLGFNPNANANLLPMLPIRISVNDSTSTSRKLFTGFLKPRESPTATYTPNWGEITFDCYDALAWMAGVNLPPLMDAKFQPAPAYGGFTAGPMIALLDGAYGPLFPAWQTQTVDAGQGIMGDVPLGLDWLQFVQQLALSEGGAVYVLADGTVNFDDRMAWFVDSRQSSSQVTFDQLGSAGPSFKADGLNMRYAQTYTSASVSTLSNPSATYSFSASNVNTYGQAAFPAITGCYLSSSTEAQALAERIVQTSSTPTWSPGGIRLSPRKSSTVLDAAVKRELRDFVTVKTNKASGQLTSLCHVESIAHSVDFSTGEWTCDLGFSSRDQLLANYGATPAWFVLDSATLGLLDGTRRLVW
jgi:hypothetical protein